MLAPGLYLSGSMFRVPWCFHGCPSVRRSKRKHTASRLATSFPTKLRSVLGTGADSGGAAIRSGGAYGACIAGGNESNGALAAATAGMKPSHPLPVGGVNHPDSICSEGASWLVSSVEWLKVRCKMLWVSVPRVASPTTSVLLFLLESLSSHVVINYPGWESQTAGIWRTQHHMWRALA